MRNNGNGTFTDVINASGLQDLTLPVLKIKPMILTMTGMLILYLVE